MKQNDDYYTAMQNNQGWVRILESFARFVAPKQDETVVDVGTGPGALANIFQKEYGANAIGFDYSLLLLQRAQESYPDLQFTVGALPYFPFRTNSIDIATATNVLYLLPNPQSALNDIARALKPDGALVMLNPSPAMSVESATTLADERQLTGFERENFIDWGAVAEANVRWSEDDIAAMYKQAGLTLTDTQTRIGPGLVIYARGRKTKH